MKLAGHLGLVQVHRGTITIQQQMYNVVNLREITSWFVKIPMEMGGKEDILKSMGKNIAKNLTWEMRKKKMQQWLTVTAITACIFPVLSYIGLIC